MNTNLPTDQQVRDYMLAKLEKVMAITNHGSTCFEIRADNFAKVPDRVTYRCYNEHIGHAETCDSASAALASFAKKAGKYTPEQLAARKREQAEKLLKEAEQIESQNQQ